MTPKSRKWVRELHVSAKVKFLRRNWLRSQIWQQIWWEWPLTHGRYLFRQLKKIKGIVLHSWAQIPHWRIEDEKRIGYRDRLLLNASAFEEGTRKIRYQRKRRNDWIVKKRATKVQSPERHLWHVFRKGRSSQQCWILPTRWAEWGHVSTH